jgi:hypothetical protein
MEWRNDADDADERFPFGLRSDALQKLCSLAVGITYSDDTDTIRSTLFFEV